MGIYHIEPLGRNNNREILDVLRSAPNVTENLTVCFDRQPDFFRLAGIRYDPFYYYGYFRSNQLKGFCGMGYHNAMVNSRSTMVFHMRDYYVSKDARGTGFGLQVAEKFYKETHNNIDTGYVVILAGNKPSLSYVGHRNVAFPYLPYSRIINQLDVRNLMILWPVSAAGNYHIRKAEEEDIPEIVGMLNTEHRDRLFGKVFSTDDFWDYLGRCPGLNIHDYHLALDRSGKPCGVCAAWDCRDFKQTRVLEYGRRFRLAKALFSGFSMIFNVPPLPSPGDCFRDLILTDYAAKNRDPGIMNALLRFIYSEARRKHYQNIMWGSSVDDPILSATRGFFCQRIVSNIILVSRNKAMMAEGAIRNNLPYIEIPCL